MVPVEAMASGRPVVPFGRGGATETVATAFRAIFAEQTVEAIASAVKSLAIIATDSGKIAAHAGQFGRDQFFSEDAYVYRSPAGRENQ
jgi:hypothetical protein